MGVWVWAWLLMEGFVFGLTPAQEEVVVPPRQGQGRTVALSPQSGAGCIARGGRSVEGTQSGAPPPFPHLPGCCSVARFLSSSNIEGRRVAGSGFAPAASQPPAVTLAACGRSSRLARGAG